MIHLYAGMRKKFGKTINAVVHSAEELVRAAEANRPGFRNSIKKNGRYIIVRGDSLKEGKEVVTEEVEMKFSNKDWHIIPVPAGAGGNGVFMTILGVVLIVVGVVYGYVTGDWSTASQIIIAGVGMAAGGISMMMAPSPPTMDYAKKAKPDERPSYLFDGPKNTLEPGLTIPVCYGESFIGSIFLSGGLEITDQTI